jgi:hypothetical protein
MGVMLGTDSVPFGQGGTGIVTGSGSTFDAAGRMIDQATSGSDPNTSATWGNDATRQFDAENHLTHESYTGDPSESSPISYGAATYAWGSNGHPIAIGSGYSTNSANPAVSYDTLHWDGNALLFTTNAQGQVDDIKVGDVADITPSGGLIFYDRGFGNEVSFCHSKNGADGTGADSYVVNGGRQGPQESNPCGLLTGAPATALWAGPVVGAINGGVGQGGIVTMPRSDGLSDGYNTVQGTRSYDSSVGNWTTPDAYAGDAHDPMSQKPYMWNRNNPLEYSDPSGYYSQIINDTPNHDLAKKAAKVRQNALKKEEYWHGQAGAEARKNEETYRRLVNDMTPGVGNMIIEGAKLGGRYDQKVTGGQALIDHPERIQINVDAETNTWESTMAEEALNSGMMRQNDHPYHDDFMTESKKGGTLYDSDFYADKFVNRFLGGGRGTLPYPQDTE